MNFATLTKSQVLHSVLRALGVAHLLHLLHFVTARAATTREAAVVGALIVAAYCAEGWASRHEAHATGPAPIAALAAAT